MNKYNRIFALLFALVCSYYSLFANDETPGAPQQKPIALTNAKIYTITQGVIQNGTIVFDKGKITAVGQNVQIPADAQIINCDGKFVYPGFIAPASTIGLQKLKRYAPHGMYQSREYITRMPKLKLRTTLIVKLFRPSVRTVYCWLM